MSTATLQIENLEFSYGPHRILSLPRFQVEEREKVFLYGPSGSGKSTLLELITGILLPQQGCLKVLGKSMTEFSSSVRDQFRADHLGYIFQSFNLIPYLNVRENIELPLHLSALRKKKAEALGLQKHFDHLVDALGIGGFQNRRVTDLSIGQQQRVAAARALYGQPEFLLADEPTSALDFDHREKFIELLFSLAQEQKMTILFVSHDRTLEKLFDRSVALKEMNRVTA